MKHSAIFLAAALFSVPAFAQSNCPEEQNLRSANSDQPTSITFINRMPDQVHLLWIDFEGRKQPYGTIPRGQAFTQQTYVSHPWAIYNRHGECLGVYFPEARPREIWLEPMG